MTLEIWPPLCNTCPLGESRPPPFIIFLEFYGTGEDRMKSVLSDLESPLHLLAAVHRGTLKAQNWIIDA